MTEGSYARPGCDSTTLVAGLGNPLCGDDGFGVEVARHMMRSRCEQGVVVREFGTRSLDLAYALLEPWQTIILIDAVARGAAPGTVSLLEPELVDGAAPPRGNRMGPAEVLAAARAMGDVLADVYIVACEPKEIVRPSEREAGLSAPVAAAVADAADLVDDLVAHLSSATV